MFSSRFNLLLIFVLLFAYCKKENDFIPSEEIKKPKLIPTGMVNLCWEEVTMGNYKFYISKYEVTNLQFAQFLNEYKSDSCYIDAKNKEIMITSLSWGLKKENGQWIPQTGYEDYPVVGVSWYGANEFCYFNNYSLPTEEEWEIAAYGGNLFSDFAYSGSNIIEDIGWFIENSNSTTHQVGLKQSNTLKIFDMTGNVWEWCKDWLFLEYNLTDFSGTKVFGLVRTPTYKYKSLRGGSWKNKTNTNAQININHMDIRTRWGAIPSEMTNYIGFRCVSKTKPKNFENCD